MNFRTPLGRARGLGSARCGTDHWLAQRISALALIPLVLWFTASMMFYMRADYVSVLNWLHSPINAVLLVLMLTALFYHAYLGLQMVLEDYIHNEWVKVSALLSVRFACISLAAAGIFSVLRIAFGG
ncbi:MAG: succinate dehydrogenase, hydrophobic membrane anchor protein [Gammaproteobacteria bacterium]|nr:succinate dehydrogenase, hydrophobic membrane anchor protein [Gammaproteobacteria bacterium]MDE2345694.1 succinate dehydrogenase, hydrophobic membrane anchor protein [Gammaproteobacteria bacterium]